MVFENVYKIVKSVPFGKVTTYRDVAKALGIRDIRLVGYALHVNPSQSTTPCHRVVKANGELAEGFGFGGKEEQKKLLLSEEIGFVDDYKVDLSKFGFVPYPLSA